MISLRCDDPYAFGLLIAPAIVQCRMLLSRTDTVQGETGTALALLASGAVRHDTACCSTVKTACSRVRPTPQHAQPQQQPRWPVIHVSHRPSRAEAAASTAATDHNNHSISSQLFCGVVGRQHLEPATGFHHDGGWTIISKAGSTPPQCC